ncbi:uncharacterized protein LOC126834842 [Adelges cooleyi]|uniref:uncharacterized protein LOC126834842 n=1 Tax=Adelges cooleyi TaxID=133065 RepID=UPI00217FA17E|nr:uncharacterized protein LOC126834842 [Adelges cooleyi]
MAVRIQTEITVVNGPEKVIKMHKIENFIDYSKLSELHFPDDPHWLDNYISNEDGPVEDEPRLLIARFRSSRSRPNRTDPNAKSIRNCVQVIALGAKESNTNIHYEIPVKPKKIKHKAAKPKDTGPGPSSYDVPSTFGKQKPYYFYCALQKRSPQLRFLDTMVSKAIRENIPGPGKYDGPKSSFDKSPKSPKPFVFPTCSLV